MGGSSVAIDVIRQVQLQPVHTSAMIVESCECEMQARSKSGSIARAKSFGTQPIDRWQQLRNMFKTLCSKRRRQKQSVSPTNHQPVLLLHQDFWLEALDVRHRYGFNLRAFHVVWKQEMAAKYATNNGDDGDAHDRSFFHWLDYGRGRHLELPECSRDTLCQTRVEYCTNEQQLQYEVSFIDDENLLQYRVSHEPVHTDHLSKWIFVLSRNDQLYVARKRKGKFHHSSFLAGAPVVAAGKIWVQHGRILAIEPHSGHFKPTLTNLTWLCRVLEQHGFDLTRIHFIKPKKWKDEWPFPCQVDHTLSNDEDGDEYDPFPIEALISDSEDS